ncbi:MAG: type 4a pilus biogenesis protein PilO [Acidimicrobiales bacterium]
MNPQSIVETLRRPAVWITVAATIIVAIIWYFAWMSPEGNKLSTEQAQESQLHTQLQQEKQVLAEYRTNQENLGTYNKLLGTFSTAVPPSEEAGPLATEIAALANSTGVDLTALGVPPTATALTNSSGTDSGLYSVAVSIDVSGKWSQCMKFLNGIYTFPRLITVQSFSPAAVASSGPSTTIDLINPPPNTVYDFTMSGTAYFSAAVSGLATTTTTLAP